MSGQTTLKLVAKETVAIRIDIAIPPENPEIKGFIMCDAIVRSKPEMDEIQRRVDEGELARDDDMLTKAPLFKNIHGLEGQEGPCDTYEKALKEVTEGPYSVYLTQALVKGYFGHFGREMVVAKNSNRPRGR